MIHDDDDGGGDDDNAAADDDDDDDNDAAAAAADADDSDDAAAADADDDDDDGDNGDADKCSNFHVLQPWMWLLHRIKVYSIHEFYCQQIHQLDQQISWEAPNWWKKMTAKLRGCPLI